MIREFIISFLFLIIVSTSNAQKNLFDNEIIVYKATSIQKGEKTTITIKLLPRNESEIHLDIEIDNNTKSRKTISTDIKYVGIDSVNTINLNIKGKVKCSYFLKNYDGFKLYIEATEIKIAKLFLPENELDYKFNGLTFKKIYNELKSK